MELKVRLVVGIIIALILSNWLWFRAGRSYGRNETVGAMTLRVPPPPVPGDCGASLVCFTDKGPVLGSSFKEDWIVCGITIDGKVKAMYGNGATCPEVAERLKGETK